MKDLLEAGVHFGHQTKRWNPKMKPYIFGERNGIYILDLGKTVKLFREAEDFVTSLATTGRTVLFVGTKRQAKDVVAEEAVRCGMYYVNERWLGGLLTNFATIQRSSGRLRTSRSDDHRYEALKEEIAERAAQEMPKGLRGMARLPTRSSSSTRARKRLRSTQRASSRFPSSASWTRTAIPTKSTSSFRATTTRCARSGCSPRGSPTPSSRAGT
jgi:hypothetical protein